MAGLALAVNAATSHAQIISEDRELLVRDGQDIDEFGSSVALKGSIALVGAPRDDDNGLSSGSAYLFNAATGQELFKLLPSDGAQDDGFGRSITLSEDFAVIGAPLNQDAGFATGSVYLFDVATGDELTKLLPDDVDLGDRFGWSLGISDTTLLIGAHCDEESGANAGSAYLFDAASQEQLSKLLASDGGPFHYFGKSAAISGDTAIISSIGHDSGRGCAYIFDVTDPSQPVEVHKLLATDAAPGDMLGLAVAIDGDRAAATAVGYAPGNIVTGCVYIFDVTTGAQLFKLTPPHNTTTTFGEALSIKGDQIIIGDPLSNSAGLQSGTAYIYDVNTGALLTELQPLDVNGPSLDRVGCSVATDGNTVLVGAEHHDHGTITSGSVYVFELEPGLTFCFGDGSGTPCPCRNSGVAGAGCVNSTGFGAVLDAAGSISVSADTLVLEATGQSDGFGLFVQARNAIRSGDGATFGDGLRCVGGGIIRLEVRISSDGETQTTTSIVTKGKISAGDTRRYQFLYRDHSGSPCGGRFNLTNGYELTWTP